MSVTLKHDDLVRVLFDIKQEPNNDSKKMDFLNLINPIMKLTIEKFPQDMAEDMAQEMKIFIMGRADYIAKAWSEDKIKNPTNYIFRVCRNAAVNYFNKASKNSTHLVSIDDVKIEPIYTPKSYEKSKIIEEVREKCLDFIKVRFTAVAEQKVAEKFLVVMLQGKRPSFLNTTLKPFAHAREQTAKDIYSIVLMKMRELITPRLEELSE